MVWTAVAEPPPSASALDTLRQGQYSQSPGYRSGAKLLNWNIDRGKHMDLVVAAARDTGADVCTFQEVDFGARRTKGRDVAQQLAESLGMNYVFAPEFQELSQSTEDGPAYHGQATLTRLPIRSVHILRFEHQSGFWTPKPLMISSLPFFQRRLGGRLALVTELDNGGQTVVIYNVHLESRGSEQGRLMQINEVLADAEKYPAEVPVIIAGDLNTKVRTSPVIPRMREAGYRSPFGDRRVRTHIIIGALDWVFIRGQVDFQDARVIRSLHASDHDPVSVGIRFAGKAEAFHAGQ